MSTKPSAFPRKVHLLPALADARARKSLAERLTCFKFSEDHARCIADAVVDPSAVRKFIGEPESPNFELRRTPIGIVKGVPCEVYATRVMPDPRNPRTSPEKKHPFAVDPGTAGDDRRYAPIPDPRSADVPGVPELVVSIENRDHLAHAHAQAKAYIRSHNDWSASIASQGVMEPIWLAATTYRHADGSPEAFALTTVDGSSRLTAVHGILANSVADFLKVRSADVPYRGDDDAKMRADLRRINDWMESGALDDDKEAVLRVMVVPAFIIVGFESERPATTFGTAVKSLVAMRHVDPPTPWGPGPEHESLADEVVEQLCAAGLVTPDEGRYLRGSLTRDEAAARHLSPDPAMRAARILDVFMQRDEAFKTAIRNAITAQSTRKQTSPRMMKELAAVLILRGLELSPRDAEQKRKYLIKAIPVAAERRGGVDWQATNRPHDQLAQAALDEVKAARATGAADPGPASVELAARSVLPLIAGGALFADRGTQNNDQLDRRQPLHIIDAMRQTARGVRQLGSVLTEQAAGKKAFVAVDAAGQPVIASTAGQPVYLTDNYLREEYPDPDVVPTPKSSGDQPREVYDRRVHELQAAIDRLDVAREQVKACREHDGSLLCEKYGVDYRVCQRWLDVLHAAGEDLAIWKNADLTYNGRRHDDDDANSNAANNEEVDDADDEDVEDEE